jgi:glycerol kinase
MIIDEGGDVVSSAQAEHTQYLPKSGWVEHDAMQIWNHTQELISKALAAANLLGSDLSAVGITNQRETVLAWDRDSGRPLANAIVWQDVRTQNDLAQLPDEVRREITAKTGLPVAPYFSGSKMQWLLENNSEVANAAAAGRLCLGTMDSWLVFKLTGGKSHITDVTNASRTLLMNLTTCQWDNELLKIFGVSTSMLPEIRSSAEIYGYTEPDGLFAAPVAIAGILGDQQAAMVGQLCFERGESKCTYGTGNFALLNSGTEIVRSKTGLLSTVCFKFGDQPTFYALEGSVAVTGSAVQWLRDQLGIINSAAEIEALAVSVADNGDCYFIPAFSGLFAPHWRSDARGTIVGLTRATNKAHIARATLEAICYQTKEIIDAMAAETGSSLNSLKVDGGITANELCMQLQADILQMEVVRPDMRETTVLGAAYAAGLAVGVWKDLAALKSMVSQTRTWKPDRNSKLATQGFERWQCAISKSLNWVDQQN